MYLPKQHIKGGMVPPLYFSILIFCNNDGFPLGDEFRFPCERQFCCLQRALRGEISVYDIFH